MVNDVNTLPTAHITLQFNAEKLVALNGFNRNAVMEFPKDFFEMFDLPGEQEDKHVKKFEFDFSKYTINAEVALEAWVDFSVTFAKFVNTYERAIEKIEARIMPYVAPGDDIDYNTRVTVYSTVKFGDSLFPVKGSARLVPIFGWGIDDEWESIS